MLAGVGIRLTCVSFDVGGKPELEHTAHGKYPLGSGSGAQDLPAVRGFKLIKCKKCLIKGTEHIHDGTHTMAHTHDGTHTKNNLCDK